VAVRILRMRGTHPTRGTVNEARILKRGESARDAAIELAECMKHRRIRRLEWSCVPLEESARGLDYHFIAR